jgi:hypothetical protein
MATAISALQLLGGTMLSSGAGQAAIGALAGQKLAGKPSAAPKLPEAKVAPTPDDMAARRGKERAAKRKYGGAGRAGTMLTSDESTLG